MAIGDKIKLFLANKAMNLTEAEQDIAWTNIGGARHLLENAVLYTAQSLTPTQQHTAQKNIGMTYPCNPNLLDNWYFVNPVNQRGQTSYSGITYGIDRWKTNNQVNVGDTGVTVKRTMAVNAELLLQFLEDTLLQALAGRVVTYSALTDVGLMTVTTTLPSDPTVIWDTANCVQGGLVLDITGPAGGKKFIRFYTTVQGAEFHIIAVKLELGDQQTLAHQDASGNWVLNEIPDYGEQLRRCQRYFVRFYLPYTYQTIPANGAIRTNTTATRAAIQTPVPLRAAPAVTSNNLYAYALDGGADFYSEILSFELVQYYANVCRLGFTIQTAASNTIPLIGLRSKTAAPAYLDLSADL